MKPNDALSDTTSHEDIVEEVKQQGKDVARTQSHETVEGVRASFHAEADRQSERLVQSMRQVSRQLDDITQGKPPSEGTRADAPEGFCSEHSRLASSVVACCAMSIRPLPLHRPRKLSPARTPTPLSTRTDRPPRPQTFPRPAPPSEVVCHDGQHSEPKLREQR
jgi:hypothetical protein